MSTKITLEGKQKIEENIQKLLEEMKKLREEKNIAYNLTGDTWHDNPYFNKLEQDERALNTKINEAQELLKNAEIVEGNNRNMETVDIGSIIKCICTYPDFEEVMIFEIVGHGETDVDAGRIHYESLVAQNIMGLHLNDIVTFNTPGGEVQYKIVEFYGNWENAGGRELK
ncbi:MAG: hypothetical protein HDR21_15125 [Lachnospiraceae bacterium]|nr:hypothetical protein [Lachnospiraceae bacterium]